MAMETLPPPAILCLSIAIASAIDTAPQPGPSPIPDKSAYSIVERGSSYNIFARSVLETGPGGRSVLRQHRYTEIASGLNYLSETGSWTPAQESVAPAPAGGAWQLRNRTTLTLKWIALRLKMGAWTHVSNCLVQKRREKRKV